MSKIIPRYILGSQTNLIFYTISSIFYMEFFTVSFIGSVFLLTLILILIAILGKKVKKFWQKILSFEDINPNSLLLTGLIYDIIFSFNIHLFQKSPLTQSLLLMATEIFYMIMISKILFKKKLLWGLIFEQRVLFLSKK